MSNGVNGKNYMTLGVCVCQNILQGQTESMIGYDWISEIGR